MLVPADTASHVTSDEVSSRLDSSTLALADAAATTAITLAIGARK